jgi:hypothetical protein
MGNQLAPPAKLQSDHVADLPNVVFKDTLGGRPGSWQSRGARCLYCTRPASAALAPQRDGSAMGDEP